MIVRVIDAVVVYDAKSDTHVPLRKNDPFEADDPVVQQFPWAFRADNGDRIETATAAPGERRPR